MIKEGGIPHYESLANERSQRLYSYIDSTGGYYTNEVDRRYRSRMNVPFRVMADE